MRNNYLTLLIVLALITGCGDVSLNKEQEEFTNEYNSLNSDIKSLQWDKFYEGFGGNLPSEEKAQILSHKKKALNSLLRNDDRFVKSWNAQVDKMYRDGSSIIINASHRGIFFRMDVFDAVAVEVAKQIKTGDKIKFSGTIGAEKSLTEFGASLAPEFYFRPCEIQWNSFILLQSTCTPLARVEFL